MIVITGAYGFIGSYLVSEFNRLGRGREIVVVDDFYKNKKEPNLHNKKVREWIHRDLFLEWFSKNAFQIEFVYHLGARTDTTEQDAKLFETLNLSYSKEIWSICTEHKIPLVYASSAATYGDGQLGFDDSDEVTASLVALNPYGDSKLSFDKWALLQKDAPPNWVGLRFFNVYGPNEYHKGRMASVVYHSFLQIRKTQKMKLFRSHKSEFEDGMQIRDFIYVKDLIKILIAQLDGKLPTGIYNLGTGTARTFYDLVKTVFSALNVPESIEYIDIPSDIRDSYQYFTEANMNKFTTQYPEFTFTTLEDGITEYVTGYLNNKMKIY